MTENRGGKWKTKRMFRQNSTFKENAHLMICVIPVSGKLMEVALPRVLRQAQNISKDRVSCEINADYVFNIKIYFCLLDFFIALPNFTPYVCTVLEIRGG